MISEMRVYNERIILIKVKRGWMEVMEETARFIKGQNGGGLKGKRVKDCSKTGENKHNYL